MIDINKVMRVYSGKPGCCCGCNGKYSYRTGMQEIGLKDRGYEVSADEINDRSVKIIVNKMNKNTNTKDEGGHYFLDLGSRWYMAYMIPETK